MDKDIFTVEEECLMLIFDMSGREALLTELRSTIQYFDEPDLVETAENVMKKLEGMTDEDFSALELYPDYNDEETEV